jgi:streptogramin lyase
VPAKGSIREFAVPSSKTTPFALSSDTEGTLWFTEFYGGKIGSFDPATHAFREFPIQWPDSFPIGIITRPDSLWFTDTAGVYGRFKESDGTFNRSFLPTPIPRGG